MDDTGKISGEPFYFCSEDQSLFAWLHRPSGLPRNVGLVICPPFGYEAVCTHRSIRCFAEAAANLGVPSLRFDYLGTGDSADIDPDIDQIELWTGNVIAAAAELRRVAGVDSVLLLGIRLGALLAVLATAKCPFVKGLALLAPVVSGRRYLRELRTARLAAQLTMADGNPDVGQPTHATDIPMFVEFSGFPMSAASMETLSKLDLASLPTPVVEQLLVIDRKDIPTAYAWSESLRNAGLTTSYVALPGFVEMALVAPQFAVVPSNMLETLRQWLCDTSVRSPKVGEECALAALSIEVPAREMQVPVAPDSCRPQLTEYPVVIGIDTQIIGFVSCPPQQEVRRRGVILLNAGADFHIGASRVYVSLARRWGRAGYYVMRLDLAGLGDSGIRPGRPADDVFPPAALEDVQAAVSYMRKHFGVGEITLAGLCSGAYHSLRAAVARLPIDRIILVNPQNYFWSESDSLQGLQLAEAVHNPGMYRERITDAAAWARLLTGRGNFWRIIKVYAHRQMLALWPVIRSAARLIHVKLPRDLGADLQDIVRRGVRVTFVFASGEPGIALLRLEAGSLLDKLGPNYRLRIIERADHTFSQSGPRSALERILSEELYGSFACADPPLPVDPGDGRKVKEECA